MNRFIPANKLSKKKKKELAKEQRAVWQIKPAARVKKSAKIYDRKKRDRDMYGNASFFA